jgi:hypothetical protein
MASTHVPIGDAGRTGVRFRRLPYLTTRWEYPDRETALRANLSCGPAAKAITAAGEDRVAAAVSAAIAPFRTAAGGYALENEWRYVIASA